MASSKPPLSEQPSTLFLRRPERFELLEDRGRDRAADDDTLPPGDDRFRFEALMGRGGSARVYRVYDRLFDRPVALKLLEPTHPDLDERRLREARSQARVRHEDVLPVYETGELDGRPFLAMPLVEGFSLADLPEEVSLEETVRLLARVARALDAAHYRDLIHRDVKPSNILVERTPEGRLKPWVADFGIAAAPDRIEGGEEIAGTPAYMAPEQRTGARVDRRADVYGLGATLYRVLTGRLPTPAPPPPPRRIAPHLPKELEAVILRAMAPDPADRYATAGAVADDLERYLAGDVVSAHAAGWAYRWTKWVLRHRWAVGAGAVAVVLIFAALTVAAVAGIREAAAHERAAGRQAQAEELLAFLLGDLRTQLEPLGRLDLLDGVSGEAEAYFRAVPPEELSDGETARRAEALHQLGDLRLRRGDVAAARAAFERSLALAEALARRAPDDPERWFDLGQSRFWLGHAHEREGDLEGAEEHFRGYLEVSERRMDEHPEHPAARRELAYAYGNLASLRERTGRLREARGLLLRSLALKEAEVTAAPSDAGRRGDLAVTHTKLGEVLQALGDLDDAEDHFRRSLTLRRELVDEDPRHAPRRSHLAVSHNYLGGLLRLRGEPARARDHYRRAVRIFDALVELEPEHSVWRFQRAVNLGGEGQAALEAGEGDAAVDLLRRRHRMLEALRAADPAFAAVRLELAHSHRQLGTALADRGHLEAARNAYRSLEAEGRDEAAARVGRAATALAVGDLDQRAGRPEAARAAWRGALDAVAGSTGWRGEEIAREAARRLGEPNG